MTYFLLACFYRLVCRYKGHRVSRVEVIVRERFIASFCSRCGAIQLAIPERGKVRMLRGVR